MNETVVSNWDATNNWGSGILSAPSVETNTIERFYDDFGRYAGYALNGIRQSTLAYDPATGRLASMQIFSEESNHHSSTSTSHFNYYIWDPTEPVATRPLVWNSSNVQPFNSSTFFYTHDGNKNVSDVIASNNDVAAHYEYAPFGALTISRGESAAANPFRFSSEYAEDDTATGYYNYRHYEPVTGRWLQRDFAEDLGALNLYAILNGNPISHIDLLGLKDGMTTRGGGYKCTKLSGQTFSAHKEFIVLGAQLHF